MQTKEQLEELRNTKKTELETAVSEHDQWWEQVKQQAAQNQLRCTRLEGSIVQLNELIDAESQPSTTEPPPT